mgnify:FL=1
MIEHITQLIEKNWKYLPVAQIPCEKEAVFVTKFCQRIVGKDTKVLFLVTHKGTPVCVVKTTRDPDFNEKLRHEKESQEKVAVFGNISVPEVYFEAMVGGHCIYAEEVAQGKIIPKKTARKFEKKVVDFIAGFSSGGSMSSKELASIFLMFAPPDSTLITELARRIQSKDVLLKKGFTHSDFERPNILYRSGLLHIIDWGRAGDVPFRFIDAVYVIVGNRNIKNLEDWKKIIPEFTLYTGVDGATAEVLYCIMVICKTLRKKYPERYFAVVDGFNEYFRR